MKLSQETRDKILFLQKKYPQIRSALIPALHLAQAEIGYLPLDVQSEVAELFHLDVNDVNGVVTFYDMFHEKPQGKHILHVCKNLSCMLRGSDEIMTQLCEKLKIHPGETTSNREFTLISSECLAACDKAPMLLADDKIYGPLKEEHLDALLDEVRKSPGHACPVTGEMCHE